MDRLTAINRSTALTQEAFDRMLEWLVPQDRDGAGLKYEIIRKNITRTYARHGCTVAEELADEVINRVAERLPEVLDSYVGDPALYFYGVANKVLLEYVRKRPDPLPVPFPQPPENIERIHACLEECLKRIPREHRELILEYFQEDKRAKIEGRKHFARRLGIPLNTLRTRAYRAKLALRECVEKCLKHR
jgi:DNA-directed RNA polymerase specialized sigma24 family protein